MYLGLVALGEGEFLCGYHILSSNLETFSLNHLVAFSYQQLYFEYSFLLLLLSYYVKRVTSYE